MRVVPRLHHVDTLSPYPTAVQARPWGKERHWWACGSRNPCQPGPVRPARPGLPHATAPRHRRMWAGKGRVGGAHGVGQVGGPRCGSPTPCRVPHQPFLPCWLPPAVGPLRTTCSRRVEMRSPQAQARHAHSLTRPPAARFPDSLGCHSRRRCRSSHRHCCRRNRRRHIVCVSRPASLASHTAVSPHTAGSAGAATASGTHRPYRPPPLPAVV